MIKVKNNKISVDTWCGMMIEPTTYYELQTSEEGIWQNDCKVLTDIVSGDLIVNNGTLDILNIVLAINYLKNETIKDSTGIPLITLSPFSNSNNFRFRGTSLSGVATTATTTDIDFLLVEERWINGGFLILRNHAFGDTVSFQVVDVNNILGYGANTVLDEFIKDLYVDNTRNGQEQIILDYPAKLIAGLYIRLKYTSLGLSNVDVKCNLFLHKKMV